MRLTIITSDKFISIDGEGYKVSAFPKIDENIRAIQWDNTVGHIEFVDYSPNLVFNDITPYSRFVDAWTKAKTDFINNKKSNKPNEFVIWDDNINEWVIDPILIKKSQKPNVYSVWDDTTNDWVEDPVLKAEYERQLQISEWKSYLYSTDWYYARLAETGEEVPADVVEKRIQTRELLKTA